MRRFSPLGLFVFGSAALALATLTGCSNSDDKKPPVADAKPGDAKPSDSKPTDTSVPDTKPADTKPADTKPADTKPADTKPADTKPADTKPADTKPADTKPADTKPADTKPADTKPADTKPADTKPADTKPADTKPADTKPTEATQAVAGDPLDWPMWRGPEQNRVSRETGLIDHWDPDTGENVLWKNDEAGSISSPIVMRGNVYLINRLKPGTRYEQEEVLCLDADTGKIIWRTPHNMYLSDVPAERVGWACPVGDPATGKVYAYNSNTLLQCLDGETGKVLWERSMNEQFGFLSVFGGRTNYPIIFEDLLIISAVDTGWGDKAPPAHRLIGMDKNTGEIRWYVSTTPLPEDTTYSTPTIAVIDGQAEMILGSSDGAVWAFQPRTGRPLWNYRMSHRGLSVSPLVEGSTVYMAQNEENLDNRTQGMLCAFKASGAVPADKPLDITKTGTIWSLPGVMAGKSGPVRVDNHIYAADDSGTFYVADAKTGKKLSQVKLTGVETRSTPLVADGKIYICTTSGWHVFRPNGKGLTLVHKLRLSHEDEVQGSLVVSHGKIYLPTMARLYCLGTKDAKPAATPIPPPTAVEAPVSADDKPAQVQIVPNELLLHPGEKQQFLVRTFNDRGQFLKETAAEFTLKGPGTVDKTGLFQAPADNQLAATTITATVGGVSGQARLRIVPPLPWKFDFQKATLVANPKTKAMQANPPVTWLGIGYRHNIEEFEGRKVLVKSNTIPKGTHSQGWMGPDDLHDYTIQADIRGATNQKDDPANGLPDIGLINSRYTLTLMGAHQEVQICYWPPQIATQFSVRKAFDWKPDVWYRMKFRVSIEDGKATLRGKIWPRDDKEPDAWTIEITDDMPNTQGSPGLVGDTSNKGLAYYDNIEVYPNADPASK